MPREPRIYIEKVLYFVTARVSLDKTLFCDEQDYADYLKLLSEYKSEYGFKLYAFALMPKQLRLLIELQNNVTISTVMHDLNSRYTKTYNGRYSKKGHLFQGRFKTVLVEKDQYLLRLTRYIHLLPRQESAATDCRNYSYSSYRDYLSTPKNRIGTLEMPTMRNEIEEVLACLGEVDTREDLRGAYEAYVNSADSKEMAVVSKLLHRTAFVGSKDFSEKIKNRIKDHVVEEEKSRIVRKTNPVFILAGGLAILFLGAVAYSFYGNQSVLQEALDATTSGFEVAREDLTRRVSTLQRRVTGFEEKENYGLGGLAWELQLMSTRQEGKNQSLKDQLQFKDGKVVSLRLMVRGFLPFDYTIKKQTHGKMVWQTVQTNAEGLTVRWYGVVTGNQMRGILSESPLQGKKRDFSFMSVGRVNNG